MHFCYAKRDCDRYLEKSIDFVLPFPLAATIPFYRSDLVDKVDELFRNSRENIENDFCNAAGLQISHESVVVKLLKKLMHDKHDRKLCKIMSWLRFMDIRQRALMSRCKIISKNSTSNRGGNAKAKANAAQGLPELIEIASGKHFRENNGNKHQWDARYGWYRYDSRYALPFYDEDEEIERYNVYHASLLIRHANDGKMYLYDVMDIKKETSNPLES